MTETALTPDIYIPIIGENGKYCDSKSINIPDVGLKCGCSSTKVFLSTTSIRAHFKRNIHIRWLRELDKEDKNHFKDLQQSKQVIKQCRKQLAESQITVSELQVVISNLTVENQQLKKVTNLFELD